MPASHSSDGPLTVLVSCHALLPSDLPSRSPTLSPATIVISPTTGKIVSVTTSLLPQSNFPPDTTYVDYTPLVLLPGLVDAHVHLNEPGRTEWEGFWTGTRAAAAGGVTTVIDMPLNAIPPTTTVAAFREKLAASEGKCWVDVGFYGGVVPGNADELKPLVEAGVRGFKGFLIESGVPEFPAITPKDVALAMETLKDTPTTLMFHAEMEPCAAHAKKEKDVNNKEEDVNDKEEDVDDKEEDVDDKEEDVDDKEEDVDDKEEDVDDKEEDVNDKEEDVNNKEGHANNDPKPSPPDVTLYQTFLDSRPPALETRAVDQILSAAHIAPRLHLHIVHLSAAECIPLLRKASERGVKITAETCFHYLALAAEDISPEDTRLKCCPPIRGEANRQALWEELTDKDSCLRTVVSDHSPCIPQMKLLPEYIHATSTRTCGAMDPPPLGDFMSAWGGIASVGLGLPLLHTAARHQYRGGGPSLSLADIVRLCCQAPAEQVGLSHRKGRLAAGMDADICVFDDVQVWVVTERDMRWRNRCSPWEGYSLTGRVKETWLRGRRIFKDDGFGSVVGEPIGERITERRRE